MKLSLGRLAKMGAVYVVGIGAFGAVTLLFGAPLLAVTIAGAVRSLRRAAMRKRSWTSDLDD